MGDWEWEWEWEWDDDTMVSMIESNMRVCMELRRLLERAVHHIRRHRRWHIYETLRWELIHDRFTMFGKDPVKVYGKHLYDEFVDVLTPPTGLTRRECADRFTAVIRTCDDVLSVYATTLCRVNTLRSAGNPAWKRLARTVYEEGV